MARSKTAANAILYYEAGQSYVGMAALTDSGDHTIFTSPDANWSGYEGKEPVVRPDGLLTGGAITAAASGSNDVVDLAALTAYLAGVLVTVAADADVAVARPTAGYIMLTLAEAGYTPAVAGDVGGKKVTGGTTGDTGTLIAYNNTTRQWLVSPDDAGDVFDDDNEAITVATGTGAGTMTAVAAAATYKIDSITINSSGAVAVVTGYEGTAFATGRGVIGGPPLIPVGSFEVGQVRYTAAASAAVTSGEIFQVPGTHQERSDYPVWDEDWSLGRITFAAALPLIHTGALARKVYAAYYTPIYSEVPNASDFVPAETTHSVSSTQIYGGTVGARSSTLGQGSFTARLSTGVVDPFLSNKNKNLWFKFLPDRYRDEYILPQGVLGVSRQFPAGNSIIANCTVSADSASIDKES
jgi:hypothetical protein